MILRALTDEEKQLVLDAGTDIRYASGSSCLTILMAYQEAPNHYPVAHQVP